MNRTDTQGPPPARPLTRALRLIFTYEGGEARLVGRQQIEKLVPPSDPIAERFERSGFWYEVQDGQRRTLYRRAMQNPIRADMEVFSDDPDRSLGRVAATLPTGTFTLLVPDIEQGESVVFYGSPPEDLAREQPAQPLQSFSLR